jgi:molybdate transport system ATP-binding protein
VVDRALSVSLAQPGPIPLDVAFTCAPSDLLAIFGPSGSGKTTILRSIAGLYTPRLGTVKIGADTWLDTAAGVGLPPHRRAVGLVFQEYALFPHMTALANVMTALGHRPAAERRQRAEAMLHRVHLANHLDRRPSELSGGERLQDTLLELRASLDVPVVLVTHDLDDVRRLATHILVLDSGRAVENGPLAEGISPRV